MWMLTLLDGFCGLGKGCRRLRSGYWNTNRCVCAKKTLCGRRSPGSSSCRSRQSLHGMGRFCTPLLHNGPRSLLAVDIVSKGTHRLWPS